MALHVKQAVSPPKSQVAQVLWQGVQRVERGSLYFPAEQEQVPLTGLGSGEGQLRQLLSRPPLQVEQLAWQTVQFPVEEFM